MRKVLVVCLTVALLATVGAMANVEKLQERSNPADYSNDFQVGAAAPAATQYLEAFEAGVPPAGWTVTDNETDGVIWMTNTAWGDPNRTNGAGESAACNTDTAGSGIELDTELISPHFDFCLSTASGLLAKLYYENLAGSDFLDIDVSVDKGATWVNILSWNEDHFAEDVSLDLSPYDGLPSVTIRVRYYDPNVNDWDWDAQVDDFELTSDGTIVPGQGTCTGPQEGNGEPTPATSTTGVIILAVLLMLGGSLFVVLRRRTV